MESLRAFEVAASVPLPIVGVVRELSSTDGGAGQPSVPGIDASDAPKPNAQRRRVLVADDEAAIRALVTTFLTRSGYDVDLAKDGQAAIEMLGRSSYDAVVTDLMMPRVDGVGVVRYIEKEQPELLARTIVLTAYPRLADESHIDELCAIVAKPFELSNLRNLLTAMFEQDRAAG